MGQTISTTNASTSCESIEAPEAPKAPESDTTQGNIYAIFKNNLILGYTQDMNIVNNTLLRLRQQIMMKFIKKIHDHHLEWVEESFESTTKYILVSTKKCLFLSYDLEEATVGYFVIPCLDNVCEEDEQSSESEEEYSEDEQSEADELCESDEEVEISETDESNDQTEADKEKRD
jgi:hypothetical protein